MATKILKINIREGDELILKITKKKKKFVKVGNEEIEIPREGFVDTAWYSGHQYFNGYFGKRGEIIVNQDFWGQKGLKVGVVVWSIAEKRWMQYWYIPGFAEL